MPTGDSKKIIKEFLPSFEQLTQSKHFFQLRKPQWYH
jgi:hypothetical protein